MFVPIKHLTTGSPDDAMIAAMRLVLAVLALLVIFLDPTVVAPNISVPLTILSGYLFYSAFLYVLARQGQGGPLAAFAHWVDVGWYVVLIGFSKGAQSIFFPFFFFAMLTAAFRWGFTTGWRVTIASASLFTIVGFVMGPSSPGGDLSRLLLRPVCLVGLGYMIAYWGGLENILKQRLAFLKEVTTLSNPRFGIDRMTQSLLERLRAFYDADVCLLGMLDLFTATSKSYAALRHGAPAQAEAEEVSRKLLARLSILPEQYAWVVQRRRRLWPPWHTCPALAGYDMTTGERLPSTAEICTLLSEPSITVPVSYRGVTLGRLYLAAPHPTAFAQHDIAFLLQVMEHTMPSLENIRLVDRLASDAAEAERHRIARDIHDSIIQPYIGLQMGLEATRQKLLAGRGSVLPDMEFLLELTTLGIADLRRYVHGLKDGVEPEDGLLPAMQRYVKKFADATGMTIEIETAGKIPMNDRLAAEVFQMFVEGLSNVRRHSTSTWARVHLACHENLLTLRIDNTASSDTSACFMPRSLSERAAALGGTVQVSSLAARVTAVLITIPL
jgi:signal transduction histidine kinase